MTTYYLNADTGVDSGAGGIGAPWLTIAYAYDHSAVGDILVLQNSVAHYAWVTDSITSRTLRGEQDDGSGAIIDANNTDITWTFSGGDITIERVKFTGTLKTVDTLFVIATLHTFTFNNVDFSDLTFYSSPASHGMFGNNNGATPFGTLTFNNCLFDTCYCNNTANAGFVCMRSATTATTLNVIGCTIYLPVPAAGKYNPQCFDTGGAGYGAQGKVYKNTIFANEGGGTFNVESTVCYSNTAANTLTYCDRHNTGIGGSMPGYPASQPTDVTGTITSDPLLVDPDNGVFELRQTSPCLNTGALI